MTGEAVLVDTNIFIDLMKGDQNIASILSAHKILYTSPVVLAELYFGAERSGNPHRHRTKISTALVSSVVLPITEQTAQAFVKIKLALLLKGTPIPENDIWIAAAAIEHHLPVVTADKHFSLVAGIQLVYNFQLSSVGNFSFLPKLLRPTDKHPCYRFVFHNCSSKTSGAPSALPSQRKIFTQSPKLSFA